MWPDPISPVFKAYLMFLSLFAVGKPRHTKIEDVAPDYVAGRCWHWEGSQLCWVYSVPWSRCGWWPNTLNPRLLVQDPCISEEVALKQERRWRGTCGPRIGHQGAFEECRDRGMKTFMSEGRRYHQTGLERMCRSFSVSSLALHTSLLVLPCWRENQGVETLSKVAFWSVLSPSGKFSDSSGQGGNSRPHCPTQYSALMEMFYICSAQYGSHCPHGLLKLWSAPLNIYFYLTLIHLNANTMFYLNVKKKISI